MRSPMFGGYGLVTAYASQLGLWVAVPALALVLVLHASFQHEIIHGHPFRSRVANDALGFTALGLLHPVTSGFAIPIWPIITTRP